MQFRLLAVMAAVAAPTLVNAGDAKGGFYYGDDFGWPAWDVSCDGTSTVQTAYSFDYWSWNNIWVGDLTAPCQISVACENGDGDLKSETIVGTEEGSGNRRYDPCEEFDGYETKHVTAQCFC